MQLLLMGNLWAISIQLEGYDKGILYLPIFSFFVLRPLSSQLQQVERIGQLKGMSTSVGGPRLNHLLFANDNLLFCKANLVE